MLGAGLRRLNGDGPRHGNFREDTGPQKTQGREAKQRRGEERRRTCLEDDAYGVVPLVADTVRDDLQGRARLLAGGPKIGTFRHVASAYELTGGKPIQTAE